MKRLRIIDLITGDQPISNEDGSVTVVFNGEIYNFLGLRKQLKSNGHRLTTQTDTEVIAHLYEDKGPPFLQDLNGMFSLAIWDSRGNQLLLARDRLGIKPLYYCWNGERLAFASEIKGILTDPEIPREIDPLGLQDYLLFQNVFGSKTLFSGIWSLEPGTFLTVGDTRLTLRRYWDLPIRSNQGDGLAFASMYGRLLEDSVRMQLTSDVPIGCHLSGGLDSSSIVAVAARLKGVPSTFSITFKGTEDDESEYIHEVSALLKTDHHECELDPSSFPDIFPKIMWHLDEPRVGPGVFPQYVLAEFAKKYVTVVLTGHGGDELFGGYPPYLAAALRDASLSPRSLLPFAATLGRLRGEGLMRTAGLLLVAHASPEMRRYGRQALYRSSELFRLRSSLNEEASAHYDPRVNFEDVLRTCRSKSTLDSMAFLDTKTYLPSLLLVEDRMCMAHSLEDRVPFLDHRIVEFAFSIPPSQKIRGFELKAIPREYAKSHLPASVVAHRKVGFTFPMGEWLRGPLRSYVEREVLDGGLASLGFSPDGLDEILRQHMIGRNREMQVWCLLNLAVWNRVVLRGHGSS